jgi:hypothetical protein
MATLAKDLITISLQFIFLTKEPALGLLVHSELWRHVSTAATPTVPYCHRRDGYRRTAVASVYNKPG